MTKRLLGGMNEQENILVVCRGRSPSTAPPFLHWEMGHPAPLDPGTKAESPVHVRQGQRTLAEPSRSCAQAPPPPCLGKDPPPWLPLSSALCPFILPALSSPPPASFSLVSSISSLVFFFLFFGGGEGWWEEYKETLTLYQNNF